MAFEGGFGASTFGGFGSFSSEMMSGTFRADITDETVALMEKGGEETTIQQNLQYSPLVAYIEGRYTRSKQARFFDEGRWLEAYRNYRGIYGPDVQFTSTEKSRAFIKVTKMKVQAAYAQITEAMFANNTFPLGVEATKIPEGIEESVYFDPKEQTAQTPQGQPQQGASQAPQTSATIARPSIMKSLGPAAEVLAPIQDKLKSGESSSPSAINFEPAKMAAELMNKKMQDQLEEAGADKALRGMTFELVLFGTGVFKGPILKEKEYPKWEKDGTYAPVRKIIGDVGLVSIWDAYPDPDARNMEEAEYFIQRHRMSKSELRNLKKRPFFREESINQAIILGASYQEEYWETTLRDDKSESPNERYEVLEFWGVIDSDIEDLTGIERPDAFKDADEVHVNAWICNGQLLRLVYNPFTPVRIPYYMAPYELNPYSIFGIGVGENMADTQLLMNGFARLLVDNAVLSSNIIFEINENSLSPGEDFALYPGKVFKTNGPVGQSIFAHKFDNVTQECILAFDKFRQLADEATGLPSYSHGMSGVMSTGRTAAGMNMLMGAADKNIRSVIRNIDDYIIVPMGKSLYAFNMQFDFSEQFIGDLDIVALGTENFLRTEVRTQKILQFLQITANPMDAPFTKRDYLLRELAKSMEIDAEKAINDSRMAIIQAEQMKALAIAQGIPPEQMTQQGAGGGAGAAGGIPAVGGPNASGQGQAPGQPGFTGGGGNNNPQGQTGAQPQQGTGKPQ